MCLVSNGSGLLLYRRKERNFGTHGHTCSQFPFPPINLDFYWLYFHRLQETLTEEQKSERREAARIAAEQRAKDFKQGGGGESLKAKAKRQEEIREKNAGTSNNNGMRWQVG